MKFRTTRETAKILGIMPENLLQKIQQWVIDPPSKMKSGDYLWTDDDIIRAGRAICQCDISDKINLKAKK